MRIHRTTLFKTLGFGHKIPLDFAGEFPRTACYSFPPEWEERVGRAPETVTLDIVIRKSFPPKNGWKSSTHRVFVKCKCGREMPTGRYGQHKCGA